MAARKWLMAVPIICISCNIYAETVDAAWSPDPTVGTAISTVTNNQSFPKIISNGIGGAIITWQDSRNGNSDIYAQRIDMDGVVQWTVDGVAVSTAAQYQNEPKIISDGYGGAIITWYDSRNGAMARDIYAQRINASGEAQWTADGVAICIAPGYKNTPNLISDGSGGAIMTWADSRSGSMNSDIYVQRINASGEIQWIANGVVISAAIGNQYLPAIISDGNDGAIITWQDARDGYNDIYAQRINASGQAQWTTNGVAISTAGEDQYSPKLISDGHGGAIITWQDYRPVDYADIYAQRINASGAVQWTANGQAICTAADEQDDQRIISDGKDGAIIVWKDNRSGSKWDIYAQRINTNGAAQWAGDGVAISTSPGDEEAPQTISDGKGGAIIAWQDNRNGGYSDIYAQQINAGGLTQWTAEGAAISTATDHQYNLDIVSSGKDKAIITWDDSRNGEDAIYAQQKDYASSFWILMTPTLIKNKAD